MSYNVPVIPEYDNLDILCGMDYNVIDMIATNPRFNKNKDLHAMPNSLIAGASFQDRWRWTDVRDDWIGVIKTDHAGVWSAIRAANESYGDDMGASTCFLGVRILEMRRVLKQTILLLYLHCYPTTIHYVKKYYWTVYSAERTFATR